MLIHDEPAQLLPQTVQQSYNYDANIRFSYKYLRTKKNCNKSNRLIFNRNTITEKAFEKLRKEQKLLRHKIDL